MIGARNRHALRTSIIVCLDFRLPKTKRAYQKVSPGWRTFVPIYLSVNCFIVSGPITFDFAHVMQHPSRQLHQRYGKRLS